MEEKEEENMTAKRFMEQEHILTRMQIYITDALNLALSAKGDMLIKGNIHAMLFFQGSIDILLDLSDIMDGKTIPSFKDIANRIQKETANKEREEQKYHQ